MRFLSISKCCRNMDVGSFYTRNYGRFRDESYNKLPNISITHLENMEATRKSVKTSRNAGPPRLLPLFHRRKNSEDFMGIENFLYGKSFETKEERAFMGFEPENIWKGSYGTFTRTELPSSRQTFVGDKNFSNKRKLSTFDDMNISSDVSTQIRREGKTWNGGDDDDFEDVYVSRDEHVSLRQMKLLKTFEAANTTAVHFSEKFPNDGFDSKRSQVCISKPPSFSSSTLHSLAKLTANCYKNERSSNSSYATKLGLTPERLCELPRNRSKTFERSSSFDVCPLSPTSCSSLFRNLHSSSDNADNVSPTPGSDYSEVSCRRSVASKEGNECVESTRNDEAVCSVEEKSQQIVSEESADFELKCGMCCYSGKSRTDLAEHLKSSHSTFQCNICNFSTRSQTRLTRHVVENHSKFEKEKPCKKKLESRKSKRLRKYTCKQCSFSTSIQEDIWRHTRVHVPASKLLTCPRCPFVCAFKHHMQYHLNNHFGFKPYKCDLCNYRCNNKSMLNSHLKSHSNEYPFKCHKCSYASKYRQALYIHGIKSNHMPNDAFHNSEPLESLSLHLEKWSRFQKDSINSVQSEEINYSSSVNSPVGTALTRADQPVDDNGTAVYKELRSTQSMEKINIKQKDNFVQFKKSFQLESLLTKENDFSTPSSLLQNSISVNISENYNNLPGSFPNSKTGPLSNSGMQYINSNQCIPLQPYERVSQPCESVILDLRTNQRREELAKENDDLMKCHHCQITFEDVTLFRFHSDCHTPGFPFKCKLCGQLTEDRRQFFVHLCQNSHSVASTKQLLL